MPRTVGPSTVHGCNHNNHRTVSVNEYRTNRFHYENKYYFGSFSQNHEIDKKNLSNVNGTKNYKVFVSFNFSDEAFTVKVLLLLKFYKSCIQHSFLLHDPILLYLW